MKFNTTNMNELPMMSVIPMVTDSSERVEKTFDIFSMMLRKRIVFINGPVEDAMASIAVAQLLYLEAEDPHKPIYMYINSPGGVVTSGMAIYDTMMYIKPQITTVCMGQACSFGSILLTAGEKGHRYVLPNARVMIHQPLGGAQGQATDMEIHVNEILKMKKSINNIYVRHTGQKLSVIEKKMERDYFMDAKEALDFGIVDKIVQQSD